MKASTGGADREVKIVDVGRYNVGVAVLRRGALKPGGTLGGINHTKVTEVNYVVSGGALPGSRPLTLTDVKPTCRCAGPIVILHEGGATQDDVRKTTEPTGGRGRS